MRIILSRTDSIGDVVLTLPMAAALKQAIPGCTVIFLCREYTRPVVELCPDVDEIVCWPHSSPPCLGRGRGWGADSPPCLGRAWGWGADAIIHVFPDKEVCRAAKRAKIPLRIATAGRYYTWLTCNRLLHIPRKNSNLHEAQLNLKLLKGLGIRWEWTREEIGGLYRVFGVNEQSNIRTIEHSNNRTIEHSNNRTIERTNVEIRSKIKNRVFEYSSIQKLFTVILHPKSKGSAREWGLDNFSRLIGLLPADRYRILITGTKEEGARMSGFLEQHRDRVEDLTGKLTLSDLISLIASSDALVAASTGPLHIAAMTGIKAIGLYAPMRPIFPQRWAPLGPNAKALVIGKNCHDCRKGMDCACIRSITPETVANELGAVI